jgi:Tfp pilus assembly protein PilO
MVLLAALMVAFLVFLKKTNVDSRRLQAELRKIEADRARLVTVERELAQLRRSVPHDADVPAFIESLYLCAQETSARNHTVVTVERGGGAAGIERTNRAPVKGKDGLERHHLLVSLQGSYRDLAEYIRLVQNMERFKKITAFQMKPADGILSATVELELYTLQVPHGI